VPGISGALPCAQSADTDTPCAVASMQSAEPNGQLHLEVRLACTAAPHRPFSSPSPLRAQGATCVAEGSAKNGKRQYFHFTVNIKAGQREGKKKKKDGHAAGMYRVRPRRWPRGLQPRASFRIMPPGTVG
jgi:hypothetical protein